MRTSLLFLITALALAGCALSGHSESEPLPEATVDAFRTALQTGDEAGIHAITAPDVTIFESGKVEASLEEYASGHMKSDMNFLAAVALETLSRTVERSGDLAAVATRSRISGTYRDKELDLYSTETMVLRLEHGQWRIRQIHWSSRPATKDH